MTQRLPPYRVNGKFAKRPTPTVVTPRNETLTVSRIVSVDPPSKKPSLWPLLLLVAVSLALVCWPYHAFLISLFSR